ncbi:MAG: tetratricopeptide repeat protein [Deltaproteobacteria bacterium]|nr:tetratricopeptide repeat protein [Candidatus Deferrimicrobiaceae bacterium]
MTPEWIAPPRRGGLRSWLPLRRSLEGALYLTSPPLLRRLRRIDLQRLPFLAVLLLAVLAAGGCSRVPKIIVLQDPLTAAEHVELGVAYERKGELDLAKRQYEMALGKDKGFYQARINLGNVYLAQKEYDQARGEYLRALESRPGDAEASNNLAWASIYSGKGIDEALARMEAVVAGPGGRSATLLDTLGVLRMHANRPEAAEEAFGAAEAVCGQAGDSPGGETRGEEACPEEVRREIGLHRQELRRRFPSPAAPPALIK